MYRIFINNTDVTDKVERKTLAITEQLNNRRNTVSFWVLDLEVSEGQKVEIYKGSIIKSLDADPKKIFVDKTYEFEGRYFSGQEITLDFETAEEKKVIDSINYSENSITFTENIIWSFVSGDLLWIKIFAWTTLKLPDQNLGKSETLLNTVQVVDYSSIFNNENVVETFEDQYAKEILGRSIYEFVARDEENLAEGFENLTGIVWSGVATTPSLDTSNMIYWNSSLEIGASAAGIATYSIVLEATHDITNLTHARYWLKTPETISTIVTSLTIKIGNDGSNYLEFTKVFSEGDLWDYLSVKFSEGIETGTVNKTAIDFVEFSFTTTSAISSGDILLDDLRFSSGGFTLNNCERWSIIFKDVRVQYKKPTELVEKLAKEVGFFWFIDYERDLHFFASDSKTAPIEITPTSNNFGDFKRSIDISQLKNRQTIRGGIAVADNRYIQEKVVDWKETSFTLDYPPKDLKVYVDITGVGDAFVEKTVWIENLADETSVDYLFNFAEKVVRKGAASVIPLDGLIKLDYLPYKDIRVRYQDLASIVKMKAITGSNGVYDWKVINDESIRTFNDARIRARAEIEAYKNPIVTITFNTNSENLEAWQLLKIVDTTRNIDDTFLIQKVKIKSKDTDNFLTSVTAASTLFGYIEFFQLLFKKTERGLIDVNELVDIVINMDEVMLFTDSYILTKKDHIFYAMGPTPNETPNDAYADFSETS